MKINKKIKIITITVFCALLFSTCIVLADKLDDSFKGGVKVEQIVNPLDINYRYIIHQKWAWASTRKEENGRESYQGRHYLRCYKEGPPMFSCDTGRVYRNSGFYLESPKVVFTGNTIHVFGGGFKSCYGN